MTKTAALPKPPAAAARRAREQFDPTRLPKKAADIAQGKSYAATLTANVCENLPHPDKGRYYVRWEGRAGLTLHVTRNRKTLYGRVRGKSDGDWQCLGELGELLDKCGSFPAIAAHAAAILGQVATGRADPTAERATARAITRAAGRSVREVVADYLATPSKHGEPRAASTVRGVTGSIRRFCGEAWDRPMRALCDAATLAELYAVRAAVSRLDANKAMTELDSLGKCLPDYTALHLAVLATRNQRHINPGPKSYRACGYDQRKPLAIVAHWDRITSEGHTANYRAVALRFYVSLFLPLRISTLSALRWAWLHEDENGGGLLRIPAKLFKQTANVRAQKVIDMPVPPRLYDRMKWARARAETALMFPSATDPKTPMKEVTAEFKTAYGIESIHWVAGESKGRQDGRYCTIHDSRRLAAALTNAHSIGPTNALKGLLTHSHLRGDTTDRYIGAAPYWLVRDLTHAYEAFLWSH